MTDHSRKNSTGLFQEGENDSTLATLLIQFTWRGINKKKAYNYTNEALEKNSIN